MQQETAVSERASVISARRLDTLQRCAAPRSQRTAKWLDEESYSEDQVKVDEAPIFKVGEKSHPPFIVELVVNDKPLILEVDPGAAVTIISQEMYKKMFPRLPLLPSSVLLRSYTGNQVQVQG